MLLEKVFIFFAEASWKLCGSKPFTRRHWKTPSPFVWKIQIPHFHATLEKAFAEAPRVIAEALLEKSLKSLLRGSSRKLLFWTCSRGRKNAGRGSFAEGPAEGLPYVHLKYEGKKSKLSWSFYSWGSLGPCRNGWRISCSIATLCSEKPFQRHRQRGNLGMWMGWM